MFAVFILNHLFCFPSRRPDFLDSCRANTLLAELDDEEDLPEPDDDDDENEDDNQEDQEYEEVLVIRLRYFWIVFPVECQQVWTSASPVSILQEEEEYETKGGRRRTWDDDFVLKRQFSALVPAFDPRPGRTNVQQTTDLEIPPPGESHTHSLPLDSSRKSLLIFYTLITNHFYLPRFSNKNRMHKSLEDLLTTFSSEPSVY